MASHEARQAAIKKAAEMVRNDRTGFLRRAGDPSPPHHTCEVCEKKTCDPVFDSEEGFAYCKECVIEMLGAERDLLLSLARKLSKWYSDTYDAETKYGRNSPLPSLTLTRIVKQARDALALHDE